MQLKSDPHIFSGMQRDISISKHKPESLYDAKNLRFTARDGDTMLSITNEKGTRHMFEYNMVGTYLGHCVVDNYIIVFTHSSDDTPDRIYKIIPGEELELLYEGNLNFSDKKIETLSIYENDNIQKVYWTDGVNQPRYIFTGNYPENRVTSNNDTQFDFVSTLNLEESITVTRKEGSGSFAPGTIQYAFTYYNKYGRQSNIFYTTLLYYISYPDRAGSPEDKISTCFQIDVTSLQTEDFDYLRVYSIHRTSENAIPTVKRIIDIDLSTVHDNKTSFTDDGEIGDTVDPTELLYMGGELISAETITQKDNTIFFGNLVLERKAIDENLKDHLCIIDKTDLSQKPESDWGISYEEFLKSYNLKKYDSPNGYYNYISNLDWSSPGFKIKEHYRLGVQFQHKTGKWSEPVFIGDYTIDGKDVNDTQIVPSIEKDSSGNYVLNEPCIRLTLDLNTTFTKDDTTKKWSEWLIDDGYKKVRPVVVFPELNDRLVLTQGMLCPTVFSKAGRKNKTPFSQSSWFLRPNILGSKPELHNSLFREYGNFAEYRHFKAISNVDPVNSSLISRAGEIQGAENEAADSKHFYVDQSIVTMHSPDIEWDNSFYSLDYTHWKLRIVGAIEFTANVGAIDIQTSTPSSGDTEGFINRTFGSLNRSKEAGRSLISGLFWNDGIIRHIPEDEDTIEKYEVVTENNAIDVVPYNFMVYPWHRTGSLNNDENRVSDGGTRTAVLKQKKISNLKFSDLNLFFQESNMLSYDISPIQLFSSDQMSLLKIPFNDSHSSLGNVNYYGNVDTLLNGKTNFYVSKDFNGVPAKIERNTSVTIGPATVNFDSQIIEEGSGAVRMKYKSTKHLVFSLTSNSDRNVVCLPTLNNTYNGTRDMSPDDMFWLSDDSPTLKLFLPIDYTCAGDPNQDSTMTGGMIAVVLGMLVLDTTNLRIYEVTKVKETEIGPGQSSAEISEHNEYASYDTEGKYFVYGTDYYKGVSPYNNGKVALMTAEETQEVTSDPYHISQAKINETPEYPYLLLGELYRDDTDSLNAFNGKTEDAIKNNLWIPAGEPVPITDNPQVDFTQGDTWYTRYDCLKTYPFTQEDENQIIEIGSFLCESRINGDGRYDRNRGQISNINMSPINFNLFNPVYNNHDSFFSYRVLDEDYYTLNNFSNQITWSKEKQNAAVVDSWTNITMANTFDLDGTMGPIRALRTWKDTIYCFQDNAISVISFNPRVQIPTSDGVPIEISNSYKLEGKVYISDSIGCSNKWTIAVTPSGIYFIDPNSKELYNLAGNQLTSISGSHGFSNWFKENELDSVFYDKNRNDLYILNNNDCLVYSEVLGQFTSFMNYEGTPAMFNVNDAFFAFRDKINDDEEETEASPAVYMFQLFDGMYNDFFGVYEEVIPEPEPEPEPEVPITISGEPETGEWEEDGVTYTSRVGATGTELPIYMYATNLNYDTENNQYSMTAENAGVLRFATVEGYIYSKLIFVGLTADYKTYFTEGEDIQLPGYFELDEDENLVWTTELTEEGELVLDFSLIVSSVQQDVSWQEIIVELSEVESEPTPDPDPEPTPEPEPEPNPGEEDGDGEGGEGGEEPSDPVDPTDPTNPTEPTDPTEPTEPTDPVEPVDPNPTEPDEPVVPSGPVYEYTPNFKPYWFEFISNQDSALNKVFSTVETRVDFTSYPDNVPKVEASTFFDLIRALNEYQNSGEVTPDARKKFRVWRVQIPRDAERRMDRIRNTWAKIKFIKDSDLENIKMELHDLSVQYFI